MEKDRRKRGPQHCPEQSYQEYEGEQVPHVRSGDADGPVIAAKTVAVPRGLSAFKNLFKHMPSLIHLVI